METNNQEEILVIITKNLAGTTDESENTRLIEWIGESKANQQYYNEVRNIWDASERKISFGKIDSTVALKRVLGRVPERGLKINIIGQWRKIAAAVIILVAAGTILLIGTGKNNRQAGENQVWNEVFAAYGTRLAIKLSDSTLVWLNSGSSLKYPVRFTEKARTVHLKGEAYFEVRSDASRPFTVETGGLKVKATGTQFNVQEYENNPVTEVTLITGRVEVFGSGTDEGMIAELKPSQHLDFNRETRSKVITVDDPSAFISWKDNKLIFRNEPLSKVMNRLGAIFNADIEIQSREIQDYRYRATFQDESLEEILKLIKLSAPIDYREVTRNPLPDGSFPRKKVIIFLSKNQPD